MSDFLSVLFIGLVVGSIYALSGTGLVLTYRISGVFNFAQGAIGMFFAYVFFQLNEGGRMNLVFGHYTQTFKLPTPVALVVVVGILAPAAGWLLDAVLFRRLRDTGTVVRIVATIGVLIALQGVAGVVWGAAAELRPNFVFPHTQVYTVGGVLLPQQHLITLLVVVVLGLGLVAFLRYSPLGVRMRAVVDRPDVSELMGVNSGAVSGFAWAIGTAFAALAGILLAPFYGTLDPLTLTLLVIIATAAAVVARLESIPLTLAGGFAIGVAQQLILRYIHGNLGLQLQPAVPFIVLLGALFLPIKWPDAPDRPPPAPKRPQREVPLQTRAIRVAIIAVVMIVPALVATAEWQARIAAVPSMALIFLSLVLLSGYAGQVSLAQAAFAGFGAFVAAHLVTDQGWPFLLAAIAGGLVTIPLGALLAFRATRLSPLFLGFATLAFGALMDQLAFNNIHFSSGLTGVPITRPSWAQGSVAFYLFSLAVFALCAVAVTNIRKGKLGLALSAMRDSPVGVASLGGSVARLKFLAFCVSAFIAGLAGALYSAAGGQASPTSFFTLQSLLVLALAVIGGISRWTGALVGAVLFLLFEPVFDLPLVHNSYIAEHIFHGQLPALLPVFFGLGAIGLAQNPHGVVEQIREGVLRAGDVVRGVRTLGRKPAAAEEPSEEAVQSESTSRADGPVAFPKGRLYHRPDCVLTVGKDDGAAVASGADPLRPCPVCEPQPAPT
ncbi:MAG: hypothetical protein ABR600_14340 [Actinomycetota bacterium]